MCGFLRGVRGNLMHVDIVCVLKGCPGQLGEYRFFMVFYGGVRGNLVHIGILWFFDGISGAIWCIQVFYRF